MQHNICVHIVVTGFWSRLEVFVRFIRCPLIHVINIGIISWGQVLVREVIFFSRLTKLGYNNFIKLDMLFLQVHILHILHP